MDNLYRVQAVSPELAALLRRLKTIYAITGGEVPKTSAGKKDDFNAKKSLLIAQLHNFDKLIDARDHAGLATDSRDYIRLKNTINLELHKLEDMVKDVAETHKKEVEKKGCVGRGGGVWLPSFQQKAHRCPRFRSKLSGEEIAARKDVLMSVISEFHTAFKAAKGFGHGGAEENLGGGVGMRVISTDALMKGSYGGAGIKTRKEALSGEQMQKLEEINTHTREQDMVLDEISRGMDELKDLAEKMHDVRGWR